MNSLYHLKEIKKRADSDYVGFTEDMLSRIAKKDVHKLLRIIEEMAIMYQMNLMEETNDEGVSEGR